MLDHYETQADGMAGALCPSCHTIKPLKEFTRRLTRGEAARRGYAGNVMVEVESSLCKSCQPKRKPMSKQTNKALLSKVSTGDLNQFIYESTIKRRKANALALQRRAASARWDKERAKPWMYLVREINKEINAVKHQRYNATKRGPTAADFLAFATFYENELIKVRSWLRLCARTKIKKNDAPPVSLWWPHHFEPEVREQVRALWEVLPMKSRVSARIPLLLQTNKAPDPSFNPLKQEDRLTQAKALLKTYE